MSWFFVAFVLALVAAILLFLTAVDLKDRRPGVSFTLILAASVLFVTAAVLETVLYGALLKLGFSLL